MEIDYGSVGVTMVEQNLLTQAGGEAALAIFIVSTLVKTQYLFLTQEYMKLLTEPKMRGDHHTCYPSKAIDAEDGDGNEDEDEDEEEEEEDKDGDGEGKEAISYEDGNPEGNKNDSDGEDDQDDNDDEEDKDGNDDDDEPNEDGDDDDELDEEGGDDEEEEEEETLQPPKKRKK